MGSHLVYTCHVILRVGIERCLLQTPQLNSKLPSVVRLLCELCNFSHIKELLEDLSDVCIITSKRVNFSAVELLIPDLPVVLKQPRCNQPS